MIFSLLGTLIIYFLSLWLLNSVLDLYFIFDVWSMLKVLGLAFASWLPFYIFNVVKTKCYPEEHEQIRMAENI